MDAAFDLGLLKNKFLKYIALRFERILLNLFDLVSTISQQMLNKAYGKGVSEDKSFFFPNWVELKSFHDDFRNNQLIAEYRKLLNLPDKSLIAMYSGSMGMKQGLEILAQVAKRFEESGLLIAPIHFIFCGDGIGRPQLMSQCEQLKNVHFMELQPVEKLPAFLLMADIHLLPQRDDVADLVMPSKLGAMLASGRPVVASSLSGSAVANIVENCGIVVPPGNYELFYDAVLELALNDVLREKLGFAGRNYSTNFLEKNLVLMSLLDKIQTLVKK